MWIVQICVASFWWYVGIHLLFRDALVWTTVGEIPWFHKVFHGPSSRRWERFCRDGGLVALSTGGLLFITLPYGIGVFGVIIAAPAMIFLL
jgi:hypothetical protein